MKTHFLNIKEIPKLLINNIGHDPIGIKVLNQAGECRSKNYESLL